MEVDPIELLGRLGDDLRRAQELTGIAPLAPATPVYEEYQAPREREAEARLAELGYADEGLAARLAAFRAEANCVSPMGAALDRTTWDDLDQLRGLEQDDIDPKRWRGADGQWLPAMRRAIVTRVVELTLPKAPKGLEREAPGVERVSKLLRAVDFVLPGELGLEGVAFEDALVPILLCDERLRATVRERSSAKAAKLRRKLDDDEPPIQGLLRELGERRALRQQQEQAEREALWPEVERLVSEHAELAERWAEFIGERKNVWRGQRHALRDLNTAAAFARDEGRSLREMVEELREDHRDLIAASRINLFQVIYLGLSEAFEATHRAAACFVEAIEAKDRGPIRLRRRLDGVRVLADRNTERDEILAFAGELARKDRSLLISAELLGVLLRITAGWKPGMGPAGVITSMIGSVPRITALGRELRCLT